MEYKKLYRRIDFPLSLYTGMMLLYSILMVYSALPAEKTFSFTSRHLLAIGLGLVILLIFANFNYQLFREAAWTFYLFFVILLLFLLLSGRPIHGGKRWLSLGLFSFQPAEPMKLAMVILLAHQLSNWRRNLQRVSSLFWPLVLAMIPAGLILLQPDMGTAMVFFPLSLGILWLGGAQTLHLFSLVSYFFIVGVITFMVSYFEQQPLIMEQHVLFFYLYKAFTTVQGILTTGIIVLIGLISVFFLLKRLRFQISSVHVLCTVLILLGGILTSYALVGGVMKEYQKRRLAIFLNPGMDPLGAGYQIIQAKVAVGSGAVMGKGLFQGTQSQLGFIPARHTDFIFAVLSEELGLVGVMTLLLLYYLILSRGLKIALQARDDFGTLLAGGITLFIFSQALINMAMVTGLLPVSGLPLPLMSYGGTAMVTDLASIGILLSIYRKRYVH